MKLKKSLLGLLITTALIGSVQAADITVAYDADPVSMDPAEQLSQGTIQMSHLVFDPLVRFDSNLQAQPRLAKSWEQVDDVTTRFYLRDDVKFHSGNPMTADDVLFSFERMQKSPDYKGVFAPYEKMVKVDNYTVDLVAKKPYPLVLANASYLFVIDKKFYSGTDKDGQPKDLIQKNANTFAATHESGTGPFTLVSRQQGVKSVYAKNTSYWTTTGNVDNLTLVPIKENATRVNALLAGDVDLIFPVPPTDLNRVKESKDDVLYTIPSDRIITFQMNENVVPQFKDARVRQAVTYAVNNNGIVKKIMRGFATTAAQNSPKGYAGYAENATPRYNITKAKELMAEAGYKDGFSITMISPNNRYVNDEKIAQATANMLAKIGIKVNLTTMPKAQYWGEYDKCAAGMAMVGWSSDTGDSANYSEYLTMTKNADAGTGQYNCGNFSNAKLDKLVTTANHTIDPTTRAELLVQASEIEYNEAAFVPLHWENLAWGYTNKFENFPQVVNLKNFPLFGDLVVKEDK